MEQRKQLEVEMADGRDNQSGVFHSCGGDFFSKSRTNILAIAQVALYLAATFFGLLLTIPLGITLVRSNCCCLTSVHTKVAGR